LSKRPVLEAEIYKKSHHYGILKAKRDLKMSDSTADGGKE